MMGRVLARAFLLAWIALLVAGAGATTSNPPSTEQLLRRAGERWEALVARDWDRAYTYSSPAYRAVFTREMYRQKFSYMVEWELTGVEVVNYDAGAAVASVAVRVMSRPVKQTSAASAAIGAVPTRIVEQWILDDGEWWYSANL